MGAVAHGDGVTKIGHEPTANSKQQAESSKYGALSKT